MPPPTDLTAPLAICAHISERVPWGCMTFPSGDSDHIHYIIYKGVGKDLPNLVNQLNNVRELNRRRVSDPLLENQDPEEIEHLKRGIREFAKTGTVYPSVRVGRFETAQGFLYHTGFEITYTQRVTLDYADPDFFTYLDQILDHIIAHDDLSGLSLQQQGPHH